MNKNKQNKTYSERRLIYDKTKSEKDKENRVRRRKEAEKGETGKRRLAFLKGIAHFFGYNQRTLADALGCTQQNVYWIFSVCDDCALSRAETILNIWKLSLHVELKRDSQTTLPNELSNAVFISNNVKNRIQGTFPSGIKATTSRLPDYISHCPDSARMRFLADFIIDLGINMSQAERTFQMSRGSLSNVFRRDDIDISILFKIAKTTNSEIIWHII